MEPRDFGKLAYQSEFGPEHLLPEGEGFLRRLQEEWSAVPGDQPPRPPEEVGNGLCRFHLKGGGPPEGGAPLLAELVRRTAREHRGTRAGLEARLDQLAALGVPGMAGWLADYRENDCPPVSHSQAFRAAYRPHYRLLAAEYAHWFPALLAVRRQMEAGTPAAVVIDGRCGSGKTTLAALLQRVFPSRVFHMDDFYLPPDRRPPDWEERPGGNMDFSRLEREVLIPVRAGRTAVYRAFDCRTGRLGEARAVPPRPLTVLEGSYSHHPALGRAFGLRLFLTCAPQAQERRLRLREGEGFQAFRKRWIPLEERYFQQGPAEADRGLTLDTSGFF